MAVTRAKRGLIVVGDSHTLCHDRHWKAFIDWCKAEGTYRVSGGVHGDHDEKGDEGGEGMVTNAGVCVDAVSEN